MKRRKARKQSSTWQWMAVWLLATGLSLAAVVGSASDAVYAVHYIYKVADSPASGPTESRAAAPSFENYIQAPELDADDNLPPIEERLPLVPLVMEASMTDSSADLQHWELGNHGGQLWLLQPPEAEFDALPFMLSENFLGAPGLGMQGLYGNLAEEYQIHPANTHFRLTLRQGLKWSDGTAVTTDDVSFTYDEIWHNELLNFMGMPRRLRTGGDPVGSPVVLEVRDDYTFYLKFDEPYGSFLTVLGGTGWFSYADMLKPSHYLKEFHPDYISSERTKELLQERGLRYEWELFESADCHAHEAREAKCQGFPVLWPWTPQGGAGAELYLQRNPYYHKVDGAGRQLPYIERVNLKSASAASQLATGRTGLYDLYLLGYDPTAGASLAPDAGDGLQTILLQGHTTTVTLFLNRTYGDENWRNLVAQPKFRQALLLGLDQESLAEMLAPGHKDHFVRPTLGHDPATAQVLLNELGLNQVDENGWRLAPDGTAFALPIDYDQNLADFERIAGKLEGDLQKIGLKAEVLGIDPLVLQARGRGNQLRGSLGTLGYPLWESELQSDYLPNDRWGSLWRLWHDTDAEKGETPPEGVQRLIELHAAHRQGRAGSVQISEMAGEILEIHAESQFGLSLVGPPTPSLVYSLQLHNLPMQGLAGFALKDSELWFWGGITE